MSHQGPQTDHGASSLDQLPPAALPQGVRLRADRTQVVRQDVPPRPGVVLPQDLALNLHVPRARPARRTLIQGEMARNRLMALTNHQGRLLICRDQATPDTAPRSPTIPLPR